MDIQGLTAFIAVVELGSFSDAAGRLYITQPAVSKRIRSLENVLKVKLFDRIGRDVILTEAGRALVPSANRIIREIKEAKQIVGNLSDSISGKLSIAISHHISLYRLPNTIKQFIARQPVVELDLHFMESENAYDEVMNRELELAFVTLPSKLDRSLTSQHLWDDPLAFVVGKEHILANRKSVRLNELCYDNALLPDIDTSTYMIVRNLFDQHRLPLKCSIPINFLETIKVMTGVGLGWSVLPKSMIDDQLIELDVEGVKLSRRLGYIQHKDRTLSNAAQAFLNTIELTR